VRFATAALLGAAQLIANVQACMMHGVTTLAIAVRNQYRGNRDFERVCLFFDTLYASDRLQLPLKGLLVIGY
jgi:hypothetical protein